MALPVLPEGFALPPVPYLLVLLLAVSAVVALLRRARPPVSARTVLAFAPWMVVGACLTVLFEVGALPPAVAPFFGTPAVYLSTFAVAGAIWLAALRTTDAAEDVLAGSGLLVTAALVAAALGYGAARDSLRFGWPAVGLVVAVLVTALAWLALRRVAPEVAAATGGVGALAVFGHALDGVSTAVGLDVLGFAERTPLSRLIIDAAAALPTAQYVGAGWLFVLVKLAVALAVVWLFADYVREDPAEGYLLLGVVAAVGLGPGAHNLLLFAVAGG